MLDPKGVSPSVLDPKGVSPSVLDNVRIPRIEEPGQASAEVIPKRSGQPFGDAAKRLLDNRLHVASLLSGSRLKEV